MAARRNRFIDTASASALVRFGPELSALKELMATSQQGYRQQTHAAQAGAAAIQAAAQTGLQQLKGVYADVPSYGIPGLSRQQAFNDMIGRGVSAQEGAVGQQRLALSNLRADEAKIAGRRSDIAQEVGAFTTSEADKLSSAAAQRDLQNRISLRTDATRRSEGAANRANARSVAKIRSTKTPAVTASKAFESKYGVPLATQQQHNSLRSKVDSAVAVIKQQRKVGSPRSRTAGLLVNGRPAIKGQSGGTQVTLPAIPRVDPFVASLALDLAYDGHVSARNANRAHKEGYAVGMLGLPGSPSPGVARPYARRGPRVA